MFISLLNSLHFNIQIAPLISGWNLNQCVSVFASLYLRCCTFTYCLVRYDNNAGGIYKDYALGPEVDAQLEVSFQANLHFPASIGRFSNVNFNAFKSAIIPTLNAKEKAHKRRRQFLLRFRFRTIKDADGAQSNSRPKLSSVEQIAVHLRPYCTFPRPIRRIRRNSDSTMTDIIDFGQKKKWRLRMAPL